MLNTTVLNSVSEPHMFFGLEAEERSTMMIYNAKNRYGDAKSMLMTGPFPQVRSQKAKRFGLL